MAIFTSPLSYFIVCAEQRHVLLIIHLSHVWLSKQEVTKTLRTMSPLAAILLLVSLKNTGVMGRQYLAAASLYCALYRKYSLNCSCVVNELHVTLQISLFLLKRFQNQDMV